MIETEDQRRWWFATHPEYSWSRTGQKNRKQPKKDDDSERIRPEEVDAYVDEQLKYEHDKTVREILKLMKFWFGTEFASKTPAE